jgi:hypothetical protein
VPQVEQDALWSLMGKDEPQVLQQAMSNPLRDGHPRHVADDEEGEEGGDGDGGSGSGSGSGGSGDGGQEDQTGNGGSNEESNGDKADRKLLEEQLAGMQQQLEEQGRLLRALCERLAAAPDAPQEQGQREEGDA